MPLGIVDEPRLIVETVGEMVGNERQNIMVGRYDGEVSAVFGLLETDELLHAELFVEYTAGNVSDCQHIGIGKVPFNTFTIPDRWGKHLIYIYWNSGVGNSDSSDSQLTEMSFKASWDNRFSKPVHTLRAFSSSVDT